jgi:hypothetical protein
LLEVLVCPASLWADGLSGVIEGALLLLVEVTKVMIATLKVVSLNGNLLGFDEMLLKMA